MAHGLKQEKNEEQEVKPHGVGRTTMVTLADRGMSPASLALLEGKRKIDIMVVVIATITITIVTITIAMLCEEGKTQL